MSTNPFEPVRSETPLEAVAKKHRLTLVEVLVVIAIFGVLVGLMMPAVRTAKGPARQMMCSNNLKQIGLALQNYHQTWGSLPPAYTMDTEGNRLHSWRTLLLPYLEQNELYEKIDLSKPWNDPVNIAATQGQIPPVFSCPSSQDRTRTLYLAVVDPDGCFPGERSIGFQEITDGLTDSLFLIEAPEGSGVDWTSPFDTDWATLSAIGEKTKLPHESIFNGVFADGSVRSMSSKTPAEVRRALLTIAAGDKDK